MPGRQTMARAIMFQGTGSNVGKSILVAGLSRALRRRGHTVRPFKPQNMSNNAAVATEGGEIGRAQALQARAAGVAPSIHMNPVLLKPSSDVGSQIVVHGKVFGTAQAREYQDFKETLLPAVLDSFGRLKSESEFVLVEGAGSASEINLRAKDIANMGFARSADVPVVLIGDIDRGGVIASIVGTKAVIDEADAALVCGFIVNKMRGDPCLFDAGMAAIAERTGWPALGLVPYFDAARYLPAEDSYDLAERSAITEPSARRGGKPDGKLKIAVPHLPRIANFDDLDPLMAEPSVDMVLIERGQPLPSDCDVVILPGSQATIADLASLQGEGWDIDLIAHHRRGGVILGLCGGYQMLGHRIADPDGLEGPAETVAGLGLLNVETVLKGPKKVTEVCGSTVGGGTPFAGYEIHMGLTTGPDTDRPVLEIDGSRNDGARSPDGRVVGCYVHGLFSGDAFRTDWLRSLGASSAIASHDTLIESTLDGLADHLETHLDIDRLITIAR